jgi:DNA-binding FadR family transcriptional regulator
MALGAVIRPNEDALENGTTKVFTFFRDKLLAGELKAGDRLLGERELALSLSVSRPVLREALRSLAMLGLLEIQRGRGAFVRSADASVLGQALTLCLASEPNILDDVMQARIAIECQAIRVACERATEQDLAGIAAALDSLLRSLDSPERSGEADHSFHLGIVQASRSAVLMKIYEALGPLLRRSLIRRMQETYRVPAITAQVVESHRTVLLALARRDPDKAEQHLREHFAIGDELRRSTFISSHEREAATHERQLPAGANQ